MSRRRDTERPRPAGAVPWRALLPTVLLPNVLYGVGQGAALPAVPLAALEMTGSPGIAATVAAALSIGQAIVALPSGWVVTTFGEQRAMLFSTLITGLGGFGAYAATSLAVFVISAVLIGSGVAVFTMARHAWITSEVAPPARARSLAAVAGSTRLGMLAGPFAAAAVVHVLGGAQASFLVVIASAAVLGITVTAVRFPSTVVMDGAVAEGVLRTMWSRRRVLLTIGMTISIITTMRNVRRVLLPVVGVMIGLDAVTVTVLTGIASGVDFAVFYLGGVVADRWGRAAVAVPTFAAFGFAHVGLVLALAGVAPMAWYLAGTMVMALANGFSGGIVATVGSDLADRRAPAAFLSSWRMTTDLVGALTPLAVTAVAVVSVGPACMVVAGLALLGVALVPRQLQAVDRDSVEEGRGTTD